MRRLNLRQQEVLLLIIKGLRNAEIGASLGLSERTVKAYVSQLLLSWQSRAYLGTMRKGMMLEGRNICYSPEQQDLILALQHQTDLTTLKV
jgi:DNA-binding CsgD family transcriptional regulator